MAGQMVPWWMTDKRRREVMEDAAAAGPDAEKADPSADPSRCVAGACQAGPSMSVSTAASAGTCSRPAAPTLSPAPRCAAGCRLPTIFMEGPFGAPALHHDRYDTLILAATGVG